jgi:4-hydroxy-3-methylbut-2-enyl diphosphate reductase
MKVSTAALVLVVAAAPSAQAFQLMPASPGRTLSSSSALFSTTEKLGMSKKKEDRLNFMKSERFHRRGFKEVREKVESAVQEQYQSSLVADLKSSNYVINKDGVKVYLAKVRHKIHCCGGAEVQSQH